MPSKKRLVAYQCDREDDFWDYLEAWGFEIEFLDFEGELVRALRALDCPVVVTAKSRAWNTAAKLATQSATGARVFLLPLEAKRVNVADPEGGEQNPGPLTRYQLASAVEKACAEPAAPEPAESTDRARGLREELVAGVERAVRGAAADRVWLGWAEKELRELAQVLDQQVPPPEGL